MEDNQQGPDPELISSLEEKLSKVRKDAEAFYTSLEDMVKDPTKGRIVELRDKAFEHAENEFTLGTILSRIILQSEDYEEEESDLTEEDWEWADDQMLIGLIEECFSLFKTTAQLLDQMKDYRRHILLELDENDELPRALSGLHDTLLERLDQLADVRDDF